MKNPNLNYKVTHADDQEGVNTWARYEKIQLRLPRALRLMIDELLTDPTVDIETLRFDITVNLTRFEISYHSN